LLTASVPASLPLIPEQLTSSGPSWLSQFWSFPLLRFFPVVAVGALEFEVLLTEVPVPEVPACLVTPLPAIEDAEALEFEANVGSEFVVNTAGLTERTERALTRFEQIVRSAGGTLTLTSAYRPASYQAHLQSVWDKWMLELRDNDWQGCQNLRADVQAEFERHALLETQRPASTSDHTLGIAFDALVILPGSKRRKRRWSPDALAARAGLRRPVAASDPVHFRLRG
jgi:hypothetical protein